MATEKTIDLYGRIFIRGHIRALTGLHIGGAPAAMAIGSIDNPVIRNPLTGRPYIPGSSLRGKMRSLWEKMTGARQNWPIGKGVTIHVCEKAADYQVCPVCQIYGIPSQLEASNPTRLVVRDAFLEDDSAKRLREQGKTDMPFTEVKWEATIDRVTSAATPRQIERVPADTLFSDLELVYSIYEQSDIDRFAYVIEAMQLLEDDYLGGSGSRGGGKIRFEGLTLALRATRSEKGYRKPIPWNQANGATSVTRLLDQQGALQSWLRENIPFDAYRMQRDQA
jgi:CRISPR-associated protein Csm3